MNFQNILNITMKGEKMIDEPRFKNIQKERDLLSVAHIKKLEEEIDMLRKQKIYLQSKLREKKGIKKDES